MKNYIANESIGIVTSSQFIRNKLKNCIELGRKARTDNDKGAHNEALICLGTALHTLEDFAAHSNYTELALQKLGESDVFACVGDRCRVNVPGSSSPVPPLVTGNMGLFDVFQSLIGELDDIAMTKSDGKNGTWQGATLRFLKQVRLSVTT